MKIVHLLSILKEKCRWSILEEIEYKKYKAGLLLLKLKAKLEKSTITRVHNKPEYTMGVCTKMCGTYSSERVQRNYTGYEREAESN